MFPSRSSDIASDLPLWAVQEDFAPGASTVTTFMGGWTEAYAKQYKLGMFGCFWNLFRYWTSLPESDPSQIRKHQNVVDP